ncbi:MAG: thermonuclease family protein [Chloroflexi bacterium]|nr:thermonuclease family protein [Chloroflexota bacterium]
MKVEVNRVIDGDTLDTSRGRVRLFGVHTPERGERCASEATDRLRSLAGDSVRLEDGPRLADQFGRILAYAYSTEGGASIDETLIREGLATAWTEDGQYRDLLVNLEREARIHGTGCLW